MGRKTTRGPHRKDGYLKYQKARAEMAIYGNKGGAAGGQAEREKVTILVVRSIPPERHDQNGEVKRKEGEGFWPEIGRAFVNKDGSITIQLDALPVGGRMQIREKEIETART